MNTTVSTPIRRGRLATAVAIAAILVSAAVPAHAGKSHMGQKPEELVTLVSHYVGGTTSCPYWSGFEMFALGTDGVRSTTPFAVPDGQRLVVTDLQWSVTPSPTSISANAMLSVYIQTSAAMSEVLYRSSVPVDAVIDATNLWYGESHLVAGISIGAGLTVCPSADSSYYGGGYANSVTSLTVQGYLIKSK
jgi:hypothetical protein